MNVRLKDLVTGMCLALAFASPVVADETNDYKLRNAPERNEEFMDWGVGMFIHWSVDVELGSVISHSLVGASDDYVERYLKELPQYFNPEDYDPEKWVKLAKLAGFKYMVFTAKHHNGFCMWPTETTDFSVKNTPYEKDMVKPFVEACRKYGMKVGLYFSPEDFLFLHQQGHDIRRRGADYAHISKNPELLDYTKAQMKELLTQYGDIDVVFLDAEDTAPMREFVHELQPQCIVTRGEMETPEQNIPKTPIPGPWEACFTLGTQWQFKPTNENYKSGSTLIEMLVDIRAKGGNLLINMGPDPSGEIPFEQERRFRELGLWLFANGESIYDIRPCPVAKEGDIWFTRSAKEPDTVYAIIPQGKNLWSRGARREFSLKTIKATEDTRISVLGQNDRVVEYKPGSNAESRFEQTGDGLKISIVRAQRIYNDHRWPNPIVVKLEGVKFAE